MNRERQKRAPIYEALEKFRRQRVVPFDVPGHKRGRGNPELVELLGERCVGIDVNSMKPLDNLCHPVSVIKEAEELAADAMVRKVYLGKHFELRRKDLSGRKLHSTDIVEAAAEASAEAEAEQQGQA